MLFETFDVGYVGKLEFYCTFNLSNCSYTSTDGWNSDLEKVIIPTILVKNEGIKIVACVGSGTPDSASGDM